MSEGHGSIEQQLQREGFYISTTVGYSMWPMLYNRRDRVVVTAKRSGERLRRGELPLYRLPNGKYVMHRVIGVRKDRYIIRGDNTYVREHVPEDWILGVVTEFYRKGKHIRTSSLPYRLYAATWHAIYPIRWALFRARRVCSKLKHQIFK